MPKPLTLQRLKIEAVHQQKSEDRIKSQREGHVISWGPTPTEDKLFNKCDA